MAGALAGPAGREDMARGVVLFGDSLFEGYDFPKTRAIPGLRVRNLGIPGDTTQGMLARVGGIHDPDFVFLLAGVNDLLFGERPEDIVAGHRRLWDAIARPGGPLLVLHPLLPVNQARLDASSWPFKDANARIYDLNFHLEALASRRGIPILDFRDPLIGPDGDLREEYTPDGLHLLPAAYGFWDEALEGFLKERLAL
jgi:lysophospholipase L1-like esterase